MSLVQLFYVSRARVTVDNEAVKAILAASRRNNYRDDITGCLLFSGRFFAQVLEGRADVTERKLELIGLDSRHTDFRLLLERQVLVRAYPDWTMGYLHDQDLEDELEALLRSTEVEPESIVDIMDRMKPDSVMGALGS